ncbi:MAG: SusD/RagB family nutrient-binding outer membrane lipoprotein [Bacteroidetes bacterium]|nr:SusD/RagB family nutrient-binding outer membrane lipoprotein [Bacteroidota bacterium]
MKNILKYNKWMLLILLFVFASCEKDFMDVNHDPSRSAESTVQLTFPAAVGSSAYVIGGYYQLLGGFWSQHWTQAIGAPQWREIDSYNLQTSDFDERQWGELYSGALNDYQYVRNLAKSNGNWSYYLMATAMQAYTYQVLADLYDKIPYTEALQGATGNLTPKYDNGSAVYDGLITSLNEALSYDYKTFKSSANPTATAVKPGTDDIIFGGDMDKWEQFVNTLKLKIYLRQCYVRPAIASAGIQSMFTANAPFLTADAKIAIFASQQNKRNPCYETFIDRLSGNISMSNTIFSILDSVADPRMPLLINKNTKSPAVYNCLVQGDYFNTTFPTGANIANLSTPVLGALDAVYFMSEAESYFLQAEAIERYGLSGNAKAKYEAGIEASFTRLGATGAAPLYAVGGRYAYPTAGNFENKLQSIIVQKWIAMTNNQGLEAFLEHNRTHYPVENANKPGSVGYVHVEGQFTISVNSATGSLFPKRLLFTESERRRNPNTPALESINKRVWWDAKP